MVFNCNLEGGGERDKCGGGGECSGAGGAGFRRLNAQLVDSAHLNGRRAGFRPVDLFVGNVEREAVWCVFIARRQRLQLHNNNNNNNEYMYFNNETKRCARTLSPFKSMRAMRCSLELMSVKYKN